MVRFGAETVATICWKVVGVLKPVGAVTEIVLVPDCAGSKAVETVPALFAKCTGLAVMVPICRTGADDVDID